MSNSKPICPLQRKCCYRNPEHFRIMRHPHLNTLLDRILENPVRPMVLPEKLNFKCTDRALLLDQLEVLYEARQMEPLIGERSHNQIVSSLRDNGEPPDYLAKQGRFNVKHKNAAPYHLFFTVVQKNKDTWDQSLSVTLPELLDKSLGEIIYSLHLNFIIDLGWLCSQYKLAEQNTDMIVFYQEQADETPTPANIQMHKMLHTNVSHCHHSKLSILQYKDGGIRVIVSTANLYKDDWQLRTQGLWMSPHLPPLSGCSKSADGESKTGFKEELLLYLAQYNRDMDRWRATVRRADFSSVNVALVVSVPGTYHADFEKDHWGHKRLSTILKEHVEIPEDEPLSTIIAQTSGLGYFGDDYKYWIESELVNSMAKTTRNNTAVNFKVIFPTIGNYENSYDIQESANYLDYSKSELLKSMWIKDNLHQWIAKCTDRSSAMPHINTFTRLSRDERKIWWFVLGSANLSLAAWGYLKRNSMCVQNYEVSVVFLPKFVTGTSSFSVEPNLECTTPMFPIPYDLPLTPYSRKDKPFVIEILEKRDRTFVNQDFYERDGNDEFDGDDN